jgi:hypothetical protein
MSPLLLLLSIFALTAAVEFFVLRRWFGRRSLVMCVFGVAIPSGIFWAALTWVLVWIQFPNMDSEGGLTGRDFFMLVGFFIVWGIIFSGISLVPAGLTAIIYRRLRSRI